MAKGYPARQEATVLPECKACGSARLRETPRGLKCQDCHALAVDPFKA